MIAHIADKLQELSQTITSEPLESVNDWRIDVWRFDDDQLHLLGQMYRQLLIPSIKEQIHSALLRHGVDLDKLLANEEDASEVITRSDLTEIAAAAALIGMEGIPSHLVHAPSVPKASRKQSAPGIDVLGVVLNERGDPSGLEEGEMLCICSVKHTVVDPSDMYYKLMTSISSTSLSDNYLSQQLRVLHGRLQERGVDADRVFLALLPHTPYGVIRIFAVGAVDETHHAAFVKYMERLPMPRHMSHFRHLTFKNISELQKIASP